jgi:hypothetical protein
LGEVTDKNGKRQNACGKKRIFKKCKQEKARGKMPKIKVRVFFTFFQKKAYICISFELLKKII